MRAFTQNSPQKYKKILKYTNLFVSSCCFLAKNMDLFAHFKKKV